MRDLDCRWIYYDEHFHYTKCLLKKAYVDALYEKFEEMKLSCPHFAMQIACECNHNDECPFENVRNQVAGVRTNDVEADEKEAQRRAVDIIKHKSENEIKTIYRNCMLSYTNSKLKSLQEDINELRQCVEEIQSFT